MKNEKNSIKKNEITIIPKILTNKISYVIKDKRVRYEAKALINLNRALKTNFSLDFRFKFQNIYSTI